MPGKTPQSQMIRAKPASDRLLWTLAFTAIAYALVTVLVYGITGAFGPGWFTASIIVYGALLSMTGIIARFSGTARQRARAPLVATGRQLTYRTTAGGVVRVAYSRGDERSTNHFAMTRRGSVPVSSIEATIDASELPAPAYRTRDIEAALDKRAAKAARTVEHGRTARHGLSS